MIETVLPLQWVKRASDDAQNVPLLIVEAILSTQREKEIWKKDEKWKTKKGGNGKKWKNENKTNIIINHHSFLKSSTNQHFKSFCREKWLEEWRKTVKCTVIMSLCKLIIIEKKIQYTYNGQGNFHAQYDHCTRLCSLKISTKKWRRQFIDNNHNLFSLKK